MNSNKKDEIFHFLNLGEYDEVIRLTKSKKNNTLDFFKYKKCDNKNIGFAYNIFNACLIGRLDPKNYSAIHNLSFKTEYQEELDELIEILLVIENSSKIPEYETLVSLTILECVRNGVEYISKNSNNYPLNAIKSKTWLDGASLREKAQLLSNYFLRKNDEKNELESLYLKAKLTNTIMGHYPNMVGPDMILVGKKFEKMGNLDKALQYYLSVELDFSRLVDDIAYEVDSEEPDIREEDIIITKSLIDALDGIKRIGQSIDQEKLHNAKLLLVEIEKMVHQTTT